MEQLSARMRRDLRLRVVDTLGQLLSTATLGEYDIYGELGRGGMAAVYLGLDLALNRKVAIKTMLPDIMQREGMVQRFKREAQTAAALSHPHVIQIYDHYEQEPADLLGDVEMWDVESGSSRKVTVTEKNLRQYRQLFDAFQKQVQAYVDTFLDRETRTALVVGGVSAESHPAEWLHQHGIQAVSERTGEPVVPSPAQTNHRRWYSAFAHER